MKRTLQISVFIILGLALMSSTIYLNDLFNYQNQLTPVYVSIDNTTIGNEITDAGATLGRVLFYDKKLSVDNTVSCASCHKQEFAFGDVVVTSQGVNGTTGRHSMRLVNSRYSDEVKGFWDERASTFEEQATMPIQDHIEMGFSGANGDPSIDSLIKKLGTIPYYSTLFDFVFGDSLITEERMQKVLAQFVKSIESFDSRFDEGRSQVANIGVAFPNFTTAENAGKDLYFSPPPAGGAGCFRCHDGPAFGIISNTNNNGVIGVIGDSTAIDLFVTKAPTLRDLVNPNGVANGQFMHDGSLNSIMEVINHYNDLVEIPANTNLDFRLSGQMHDMNLTFSQKSNLESFLLTLTGVDVYTNEKWSSPFDNEGNITVVPLEPNSIDNLGNFAKLEIYPNPASNQINVEIKSGSYQLLIFDRNGKTVKSTLINGNHVEQINELSKGLYIVKLIDLNTNNILANRFIKK